MNDEQLDSILAVADGYEKRKQTMIEVRALKDPAYLATLAEGEAIKAFEALRPLVEMVRDLERQREYLAGQLVYICKSYDHYNHCGLDCPNPDWECESTTAQQWMERAKEAGE